MRIVVTGVAGLIGSNLSEKLIRKGYNVIGIDNLKLGKLKNLNHLIRNKNFSFHNLDLSNQKKTDNFFLKITSKYKISTIWHLAANSDIKKGSVNFQIDFNDTFLTSIYLLKICKKFSINNFYFASSSAVYGDLGNIKIKEINGPLLPVSNYGSSKLASEAYISSAAEIFLKKALIFRFPNVVGKPLTHGVIFDFHKKLKKNSKKLNVLGNGLQKKIYMHVSDLLDAMFFLEKKFKKGIHVCNIGPNDKGVEVRKIAKLMSSKFGNKTNIIYQKKKIGWVGDIPSFQYDVSKIKKLGFKKKTLNSWQAILKSVSEIE
jgi:UDP-glucose 4-epimerase